MYAIVETGGKQYRVKPGDTIAVERLSGEPGDVLDLGHVLLVAGNGDSPRVGAPGVDGAVVRAEVVEHARGEKIIVFRYKSKVRYRRKTGHRQSLTRLRITDILLDGASTVAKSQPEPQTTEPVEVPEATATPTPRRRRATVPTEAIEAEMPTSAAEAGPEPSTEEETTTASDTEEA